MSRNTPCLRKTSAGGMKGYHYIRVNGRLRRLRQRDLLAGHVDVDGERIALEGREVEFSSRALPYGMIGSGSVTYLYDKSLVGTMTPTQAIRRLLGGPTSVELGGLRDLHATVAGLTRIAPAQRERSLKLAQRVADQPNGDAPTVDHGSWVLGAVTQAGTRADELLDMLEDMAGREHGVAELPAFLSATASKPALCLDVYAQLRGRPMCAKLSAAEYGRVLRGRALLLGLFPTASSDVILAERGDGTFAINLPATVHAAHRMEAVSGIVAATGKRPSIEELDRIIDVFTGPMPWARDARWDPNEDRYTDSRLHPAQEALLRQALADPQPLTELQPEAFVLAAFDDKYVQGLARTHVSTPLPGRLRRALNTVDSSASAFDVAAVCQRMSGLHGPQPQLIAEVRAALRTDDWDAVLDAADRLQQGKTTFQELRGKARTTSGPYDFALNPPNVDELTGDVPVSGIGWTGRAEGLDDNIGARSGPAAAPTAIEAALTTMLPIPGSTLITSRPGLDAYGAAAVLSARQQGVDINDAEVRQRIGRIAAAEAPQTVWKPSTFDPDQLDDADLRALAASACARGTAMGDGVASVQRWLLTGELPDGHHQQLADIRRRRKAAADDIQRRGGVRLRLDTRVPVAALETTEPGALDIGHSHAPVVIATNPGFRFGGSDTAHVKHTVAVHPSVDVDMRNGLVDMLNRLEVAHGGTAGWGGHGKLIGSPQGRSSVVPAAELADAVAEWLVAHVP